MASDELLITNVNVLINQISIQQAGVSIIRLHAENKPSSAL
jgi:hypothetical protein